MDREAAEVGDPAPRVAALEPHGACTLAVDLDDEEPERFRLGLGALDLREDLVGALRPHRGQERLDLVVRHQVDEEVGVVRPRPPDRDAHAGSS